MRRLERPVSLAQIAELVGARVNQGAPEIRLDRLASLESAQAGDLSFLSDARYGALAAGSRASAVLVTEALVGNLAAGAQPLVVADPYLAFAKAARWFESQINGDRVLPGGIHATATVEAGAILGAGVSVGARAVIEAGAEIGEGCIIGPGVVIGAGSSIGPGARIAANVTIYSECVIGRAAIVHSGTVIGSDGFGFAREDGRWVKIPQLGRVVIGDDVEIGANCAIDRGALDDTVIGDGCKLDNLIQIAHNVRIGAHSALAGCVGVAGSARIGERCMIGGGAGVLGHLEICDDVVISAMSLVTRSISKPGFYTGVFPLLENRDWERSGVLVRQLPQMRQRLRELERLIKENK